jgi:general secretion pathway protein J
MLRVESLPPTAPHRDPSGSGQCAPAAQGTAPVVLERQEGFTLLEILVATAILGIILMTIYGVLSRALYAKNHSEEHADLYASGREAVLKMADELEGSLPPTAGANVSFIGIPGTESVPTDSVQFAVVVQRQFSVSQSRGGRAIVSYSLDPVKDTPNLYALRRQEQLLTEAPPPDGGDGSENGDSSTSGDAAAPAPSTLAAYLLDQVAGLRFRYLDPLSGDWVDTWDTTAQPPPGQLYIGLPGAVEITLFLADASGGTYDFGTIVDLPLFSMPPTPVPGRTG